MFATVLPDCQWSAPIDHQWSTGVAWFKREKRKQGILLKSLQI